MDTRVGLDYIVDSTDYTQKLVAALDTDDIPVKKQVFELLSALCVYRPDGYIRALETLEHYKSLKKRRYRFQLVVDELKNSDDAEYTTALVAFLNCLIISPASLGERVSIRNEFLGLKILEVLNRFRERCKDGSHSDLAVQLDVFDEQRATDEGQFAGPEGVDLSSHMDVFFAILRQVNETPQEIPFLSILQHMLRTDLNQPLSELIWETAETLVHRATLLESKQEADRLLRASNLGGLRCHCSCHYRQNSLVSEECETTPGKKNRPNQLSLCPSEGVRTPTTLMSPSNPPTPCDLNSSPLLSCPASKLPWKSPIQRHFDPSSGALDVQEVPLKNNSVGENVPQTAKANTHCDNVVFPSKTVLLNDVFSSSYNSRDYAVGATVISEDCSNIVKDLPKIPVPPPPPPPPPIGSVFPPPPPPPLLPLRIRPQDKHVNTDMTLPQTDTPKPKAKMKSFNWSKIPVSKVIGKDNLWSRIAKDHTGSPNDLDFNAMEILFCQQPVSTSGHVSPRFRDPNDASDKRRKEIQEINLLDGKRSLNINIFLKQFRSSDESIVRILEDGAHQELGAERLRGLFKILPESDEVDLLRNFDGDKTKLGNAEKFLLQLIEVPSHKLRVESMLLKEEFLANQEFLESSIETIRCAAQELEECRKLHEILYRVLVAGNFLNAGGYAGNAAGFKMLSLLKLTDIRANKPSVTLIHYVAEEVLKKRPDLLEFPDEIQNLEEASKISMETLKADVSSLRQRVLKVSTQVTVADDQIKAQMQDFIEFAQDKVEGLQREMSELEDVRQHLADFLCEDSGTFKLEECFRVFRSFCTRFKVAAQENERRKKQEQLAEARRKQREQQIALKRRSLELPDARSGADHIMDELLGDIRRGFPQMRLDRRNPDDMLKRHSDPAMLERCGDSDSFKSRRARFLDVPDGEKKDRPSFGSVEDSLERVSFRRSGRRKRVGVELNGDSNCRERSGTSPPPRVNLPTVESHEPEMDSKQRLRTKINDWMLQNEKEQKRERDLQHKLVQERKKRLSNGQLMNGDASSGENNILEEIEESDQRQVANKKNFNSDLETNSLFDNNLKLTKNASTGRNQSFTQKIIGLIDATSDGSKSRLRSSTGDSVGEGTENKSEEDSRVCTVHEPSPQGASKKPGSDFDRFAPTRKTQRRLKLREMRIEAESIKAVGREEEKSPDLDTFTPDSSVQTKGSSPIQNEIRKVEDGNSISLAGAEEIGEERVLSDSRQTPETKDPDANKTEMSKKGNTFSRQKNSSLRSRQSRLARRINSLTTAVTSPDSAGSSAAVSESEESKSKHADSELALQSQKKSIGSVPIDHEAENKVKGHASHKVTVSTETKSKVIISKSSENSQTPSTSKSRLPLQKTVTNIPEIKTTRNVRVQQTTPANGQTITQKTEVSRKTRLKPLSQSKTSAPKCPVPAQPRVSNLTNGEAHVSKNGSPASSVASLCNVNTNVKLTKSGKAASAEKATANKITIQHNGSVKFMKNNISATKPASNLNSKPKLEKNVTHKRAFI